MNIKKHVFDNYEVYIVKTKKFKTVKIQTMFLNDYEDSDKTKLKLLSNVLCRTNERCKTEIELSKEIMNLYNPGFSIFNTYVNFHIINFRYTFLNEKFTEKGMNKKNIDFYYDLIFKPNVSNDAFEKESFNLSKKALKSMYEREMENPGVCAFKKATSLINADIPLKTPSYGNLEDLKELNEKNLYDYYKKLLETSTVKILVLGDVDEDEILSLINAKMKDKKFSKKEYKLEPYKLEKSDNEMIEIDEEEYNQSNLIMFYKIISMTEHERRYVLPIFNKILGAPFSSKLFMQVREENSLAYSIYSAFYTTYNMLYIEAGISKENYEKTLELSKDCLKQIQDGKITEKDMNIAKETCISNLKSTLDSEAGIMDSACNEVLYDIKIEEKEFNKVKIEDVINLSKKLSLDVVYLLKGVKE